MSYVARAISDEERLLSLARPHWIYLLTGFFWFSVFAGIGMAVDIHFSDFLDRFSISFLFNLKVIYFSGNVSPASVILTLVGIVAAWPFFKTYISTEIGLTNVRIVHKTGLIFVEIDQVDLEDIRAEHVYHGFFGWLLGYGKIRLDCRFIEDVKLPAISKPYRFVKASHNARLKHPDIEYGQDEFSSNIAHIDDKIRANKMKQKMKRVMITNFKKSA